MHFEIMIEMLEEHHLYKNFWIIMKFI